MVTKNRFEEDNYYMEICGDDILREVLGEQLGMRS